MSCMDTGQQRPVKERAGRLLLPIAAACILLTPPAIIAQESTGSSTPGASARGTVEVTFVDPFGISQASDLRIGAPEQLFANLEAVTVSPDNVEGGSKAVNRSGSQIPASMTVRAAPRQPITILVDDVVHGSAYSLTDFRCSYNAAGDTACDGSGYSEMSVASGTLLVGATLTGNGTRAAGDVEGSFAITISYQ